MTDAPGQIWIWVDYDGTWDGTWLADSVSLEPHRLPDAKYVRADRIEALEAELAEAKAEIERLRKALGQIACTSAGEDGCYYTNRINIQRARAALTYRTTQETHR